jgi:hypothetical protein
MKHIAYILLTLAVAGQAQTTVCGYRPGIDPTPTTGPCAPEPKPLTCPSYQHIEVSCRDIYCMRPNIYACVDDVHQVTEREWQALMKRLAELERYKPACDNGADTMCMSPAQKAKP